MAMVSDEPSISALDDSVRPDLPETNLNHLPGYFYLKNCTHVTKAASEKNHFFNSSHVEFPIIEITF